MVWWIDSDRYCVCSSKFFYHETAVDIINDRIFQTTNIMLSIETLNYDKYDICSLIKSGVNIFNVDRTVHGEDYYQKIKELIISSENVHQMFPAKCRSPVGLAVTMTVNELVDIDENVNAIILKGVTNLTELLEYKKKHNHISVPLMLWIMPWAIEDFRQMIQFTDGVFIDVSNNSTEEFYLKVIQLCKQAYKSVFIVIGDIIQDYRSLTADDLHVLAIGNKIIKYQVDGVMLSGSNSDRKNETQQVRSLVGALDAIENKANRDFYELSLTIKTPVLPWIAASLAASLAAKHSAASIIIVLTITGMSARWIANASPPCNIVAITTRKDIARRLHLHRKVIPLIYNKTCTVDWSQECWNRVVFGTTVALDVGLCRHGSKVVILTPSDHDTRYCNSLKILSIPLKCDV